MPIRPFPVPLRIGTDLCKISRVRDLLARCTKRVEHDAEVQALHRFTKRFMTLREREYFNQLYIKPNRESIDDTVRSRWVQFLAGRWAAKEACIKAVKPRRIVFSEIEVWPDQHEGIYGIILDQPAADAVLKEVTSENHQQSSKNSVSSKSGLHEYTNEGEADLEDIKKVPSLEEVDGQIVRLSISHDGEYACAVALAVSDRGAHDTGGEAAAREPNG